MDVNQTFTVLEQISVGPPPETMAGISLPFTFFDMMWLHQPHVHRLIFYRHRISRTHFEQTLIPSIKHSLSLALQHYAPIAGRIVISPNDSTTPMIRYSPGDTVPVAFSVCDSNENIFERLTSDHVKDCTILHRLVPSLPPLSRDESDGSILVPVLAVQVTQFPEVGICVGLTNHHCVGDASSIFQFMKSWAFFSRGEGGTDSVFSLPVELQPSYDRTEVRDRKGLGTFLCDVMKKISVEGTHVHRLTSITEKSRATFVVTRGDIQLLKKHVLDRKPDLAHVSAFTVICAYTWRLLVKSRNETITDKDNDDNGNNEEHFSCAADIRAKLDLPLPGNYFGNCIWTGCFVTGVKTTELTGDDGFVKATEMIGESIWRQLYSEHEDGPLRGSEDMLAFFSKPNLDRVVSVSGSPKFNYYELDLFGWGKPIKFEMPSIDVSGSICLSGARGDDDGGLEVGLSLPIPQMDIFTKLFIDGLKDL